MLGNAQLANSFQPGGDPNAAVGFDTSEVIDRILPTLHADSRANLTWWTEGNLIEWMDEGVKRLSRLAGVFVGMDSTVTTQQGVATYSLPAQHVSTLHVSSDGVPLRPAGTLELEARDPAYQTTQGTPDHWYQDLLGLGTFGLSPVPDANPHTIAQIYEGWPGTLDAGKQNTLLNAPAVLKGYLGMYVVKCAYEMEGESEMPDVAAHCGEMVAMYDQLFQQYYGEGS